MGTIAEQVYEAVKALPDQQAAEVLDFAEFLQAKKGQQLAARREQALAVLDSYVGLYDGTPFNREELHERPRVCRHQYCGLRRRALFRPAYQSAAHPCGRRDC